MNEQTPRPLNRFGTGHYSELAAHHADVVEALQTELQIAMASLSQAQVERADLAEQVASLKKLCGEQEQQLQAMRKPALEPIILKRKR